jgi:hypothetical protein
LRLLCGVKRGFVDWCDSDDLAISQVLGGMATFSSGAPLPANEPASIRKSFVAKHIFKRKKQVQSPFRMIKLSQTAVIIGLPSSPLSKFCHQSSHLRAV